MTRQVEQTGLERRIQLAEEALFAAVGVEVEQHFLHLRRTGLRVRVLSHGTGPPVLLVHGVSLCAAAWSPLFAKLQGFRLLAVDLPGHGLSDPVHYRPGGVRAHAGRLIDDIFDALALDCVPVVGHSLGGMFALWHAAAGSKRISGVSAVGVPAVALAGARVRMPLSLLTVRGLGVAALRAPGPRVGYRRLLEQGLGSAEVRMAPGSLIETLRLSARRPENARTVASLMHAIDHFRRPRVESVLSDAELAAILVPALFVLGSHDPYLSPRDARASISRIPVATVHEMSAAHGPWLVDPGRVAGLIAEHIHPPLRVADDPKAGQPEPRQVITPTRP
jgi:pimeloyl-ACP methyl ester carboxylesterase